MSGKFDNHFNGKFEAGHGPKYPMSGPRTRRTSPPDTDVQLVCLHCSREIGPGRREVTVRSTSDGRLALVCLDCLEAWLHWRPSQWTTGA